MNKELKRLNRVTQEFNELGSPKYFIINNGDKIIDINVIDDEDPVYEVKTFGDQLRAVKLLNESFYNISGQGKIKSGYIDSVVTNDRDELVVYLNSIGAVRFKDIFKKTPSSDVFFSELDKDAVGIDYDNKRLVFKNNGKSHPSLLEQNTVGSSEFFGEGVSDEFFTGRIDDIVDSEDFESENNDSYEYVANHYIN